MILVMREGDEVPLLCFTQGGASRYRKKL
jgi:hypothetical protein